MSTFAYSVAIKLSVANLASQGIRLLGADLMAAHGKAVALGDKLKALKLIAVGYGMERVGEGMLGFMGKAIDASKEYTRQLSLMNAAGMGQQEIAKATAAAWATSRDVITSSAADNLSAIRELRSVFGTRNMGEAYAILPTVQRTKGILEALTGKPQEGVGFDMVKAIELRTPGLMTEQRMQQNADLMARSLMAMGGTVNVNDFHMALKQAKTSAFGLSDDFTYSYLPTLIQEVKTKGGGAQTAGTALMSTYSAVVQGVLKKSAIPVWEQMGLISPSDVVKNSTGQMQLKPGAVQGAQLFQANPYEWANQVLAPAIAKYGAANSLNREQVISAMFGNRNAQWTVNTLIGKSQQFERDKQLIQSSGNSYDTYQKLVKTNPQLAEQAMHSQWQNILAILGFQVLPVIIPLMVDFAKALGDIGQWMHDNKLPTKIIAYSLLGLGAGFTILGKVLMTAGIIKFLGMGPLLRSLASAPFMWVWKFVKGLGEIVVDLVRFAPTVLRTLGTVLRVGFAAITSPIGLVIAGIALVALLVWNNWKEISGALKVIWSDIKLAVTQLFSGDILGALRTFGHAIALGFQTIFNTIIAGVNTLLPKAWEIGKFHFADQQQQQGPSPFIAPAKRPIVVNVHNKFDKHGIATMVTDQQAKWASKPNAGTTGFDFSRSVARPATGG